MEELARPPDEHDAPPMDAPAVPAVDVTTRAWRMARKIAVGIIGGTVLLLGLVLTFTPSPSTVVVLLGLGILATEFVWAKRFLGRVKERIARVQEWRKKKRP